MSNVGRKVMKIKKTVSAFFSPAFHTKSMQESLATLLPYPVQSVDLTSYSQRDQNLRLDAQDLLVLSAPVYAGRIPEPAAERFSRIQGNGSPAIILASFGNRAFEDALLEMQDMVQAQGFEVIGAAAFVTEHSIAKGYAADRPDMIDNEEMKIFAKKCIRKVDEMADPAAGHIQVAGNRPYRDSSGKHNIPAANERCIRCGLCARECPVGAIDPKNLESADSTLCFGCMRCSWICPKDARGIPAVDQKRIRTYLEGIAPVRKDNYFCL